MYNPFASKMHYAYVDGSPFVNSEIDRGNFPTGSSQNRYVNTDSYRWRTSYTSEHCTVRVLGITDYVYGPHASFYVHTQNAPKPVICQGELWIL